MLEPVEDKPALLPRLDLAAHLDQVATADLAGGRAEMEKAEEWMCACQQGVSWNKKV